MHVFGCDGELGSVGHLGRYRTPNGLGERVGIDLDRAHTVLITGKRGSGTTTTLCVLAEELAHTDGIAPIIIDPTGVFGAFTERVPVEVLEPTVRATALDPRAWCSMLGLDPEGTVGSLVWQARSESETLPAMQTFVATTAVPEATRRAAANHLQLADAWDIFGDPPPLFSSDAVTVVDCSGLDRIPLNAVCRAIVGETDRFDGVPWLLATEAHAVFKGVATPALCRLLSTQKREIGFVAATHRPESLLRTALTAADIVLIHRLTRAACEALQAVRPTSMHDSISERMPTRSGDALCIDDTTERVSDIRVRECDYSPCLENTRR